MIYIFLNYLSASAQSAIPIKHLDPRQSIKLGKRPANYGHIRWILDNTTSEPKSMEAKHAVGQGLTW